jgi:hypothetical protein
VGISKHRIKLRGALEAIREICIGWIRGAELPLLRDRFEGLLMLTGFEQASRSWRLREAGGWKGSDREKKGKTPHKVSFLIIAELLTATLLVELGETVHRVEGRG